MHDPKKHELQGQKVQSFSKNSHILLFQEVHGFEAEIRDTFSRWLPGWVFVISVFETVDGFVSTATGGVVIAFCPMLANKFEVHTFS